MTRDELRAIETMVGGSLKCWNTFCEGRRWLFLRAPKATANARQFWKRGPHKQGGMNSQSSNKGKDPPSQWTPSPLVCLPLQKVATLAKYFERACSGYTGNNTLPGWRCPSSCLSRWNVYVWPRWSWECANSLLSGNYDSYNSTWRLWAWVFAWQHNLRDSSLLHSLQQRTPLDRKYKPGTHLA